MSEELPIEINSEAETQTELDVTVRGHSLTVDEPEDFGGKDEGPNPLEYMFTALAGCLNVTIHTVAAERDIEVEELRIDVKGELDMEGFEDPDSDKRAGFQDIRVEIEMETDGTEETENEILEEAEDRCPVSDNLKHGTNLVVERR